MLFSPLRLKFVPLAVATLMGGVSFSAAAAPMTFGNVTLDAEYSLGGGATVDGMTDPNASIYSLSNGADYYLFTGSGNNNVFFHTYGSTGPTTYFGARASGDGHFYGMTSTKVSLSFQNTSSVAQLFNFGFNVAAGELGLTGAGTGFADLLLSIRKDGVEVARDHTTINQDATGLSCSSNDLGSLGAYMDCNALTPGSTSSNGGPFNINFGLIGAGESFTLDYDIIATVSGNLSQGTQEQLVCGYGGYATLFSEGYGGECHIEVVEVAGGAIARSGDPFSLTSADFNGTFADPNRVPEPASLALVALALGGLAATRRKKTS